MVEDVDYDCNLTAQVSLESLWPSLKTKLIHDRCGYYVHSVYTNISHINTIVLLSVDGLMSNLPTI